MHFRSKILILILFAVHINMYAQQTKVRISFQQNCPYLISNQLIDNPVVLNKFIYKNECGTTYQINQIQYFISNIAVHTTKGQWICDSTIHYVDIEKSETLNTEIALSRKISIDSIRFTFGIPQNQNKSYIFKNPPHSLMFWPDVLGGGYHYMKLNTKFIDKQDSVSLFNCHLGRGVVNDTFIDNDFTMTFPCKLTFNSKKENHYHPQIDIIMHVEKWFSQPNKIDFNLYTKGIMGKQDITSQLCENGKNVFEVVPHLEYELF